MFKIACNINFNLTLTVFRQHIDRQHIQHTTLIGYHEQKHGHYYRLFKTTRQLLESTSDSLKLDLQLTRRGQINRLRE